MRKEQTLSEKEWATFGALVAHKLVTELKRTNSVWTKINPFQCWMAMPINFVDFVSNRNAHAQYTQLNSLCVYSIFILSISYEIYFDSPLCVQLQCTNICAFLYGEYMNLIRWKFVQCVQKCSGTVKIVECLSNCTNKSVYPPHEQVWFSFYMCTYGVCILFTHSYSYTLHVKIC